MYVVFQILIDLINSFVSGLRQWFYVLILQLADRTSVSITEEEAFDLAHFLTVGLLSYLTFAAIGVLS